MKRGTLNAIVDAVMVVAMLGVLFVGILLGFFIGRGPVPQAEKYLWGLHRHDWGDIHLIFSLTLVALVILHFILHLNWIRCMSKQCLGLHWILTLILLVLIAAAILYAAISIKRARPGRYEEGGRGRGPGYGRQYEEDLGPGEGQGGGRRRGWREER